MPHSKAYRDIVGILNDAQTSALSAHRDTLTAGHSEEQASIEELRVLVAGLGQAMYAVADALDRLMPATVPYRPVTLPSKFGFRPSLGGH